MVYKMPPVRPDSPSIAQAEKARQAAAAEIKAELPTVVALVSEALKREVPQAALNAARDRPDKLMGGGVVGVNVQMSSKDFRKFERQSTTNSNLKEQLVAATNAKLTDYTVELAGPFAIERYQQREPEPSTVRFLLKVTPRARATPDSFEIP